MIDTETIHSLFRCCDFFSYTTTCVDLYYIYLYIYHKFSGEPVPSSMQDTRRKKQRKQNLVLQFTLLKKLIKKHQLHIVQFNISMFVIVFVMRPTALE